MKTDTDAIHKDQLVRFINAVYALDITCIVFLPKGEEAYVYCAQQHDGTRYFIRVQPAARPRELERAYTAVYAMQTRYGLSQIVAPYPTCQSMFTAPYGAYTVAVFPFYEGRSLYAQGASDADVIQAATLLAAIHQRVDVTTLPPLPQETFDNPFKEPILHALQAAEEYASPGDGYQRQVARLLTAQRADVLATLERMEQFQLRLQGLAVDRVLTHGDPNLDNFLKAPQGTLYLTDWGEVAIGPAERDLFAFGGKHFELFLQHYVRAREIRPLHIDIFAFYFYRWTLQEIADYATRILFQPREPVADEHAWAELQEYLPIRHDDIARGLQEVQGVLNRVVG